MDFTDTLTLDAPRRTGSGFLTASVRVARTGIQEYSGREVDPENKHGMRDRAIVRVYRPETSVFDKNSLATLAHKPVTVNHPPVAVTADNWREYAVGDVGGDIARDGDFVRVPLVVMDAAAVQTVERGKRELSCGYSCDLVFGDGQSPNGEQYDAIQSNIVYNHLSIVGVARGGPELKIGDSKAMKTILVDGHNVEVSDAAEIAVAGLVRKMAAADQAVADAAKKLTDAEAKVAELTTKLATADAQVATLTKQVTDAAITPAKLRDAAKSYADTLAKAKAIAPTTQFADSLDEPGIRKATVIARLGDVAKDWTDAQVETSFATLAVAAPVQALDALRETFATHVPVADTLVTDAQKARAARFKHFETAHLGQQAKTN